LSCDQETRSSIPPGLRRQKHRESRAWVHRRCGTWARASLTESRVAVGQRGPSSVRSGRRGWSMGVGRDSVHPRWTASSDVGEPLTDGTVVAEGCDYRLRTWPAQPAPALRDVPILTGSEPPPAAVTGHFTVTHSNQPPAELAVSHVSAASLPAHCCGTYDPGRLHPDRGTAATSPPPVRDMADPSCQILPCPRGCQAPRANLGAGEPVVLTRKVWLAHTPDAIARQRGASGDRSYRVPPVLRLSPYACPPRNCRRVIHGAPSRVGLSATGPVGWATRRRRMTRSRTPGSCSAM
jgi:hypothetical protein